jgi:uncharacterized protein YegL
MSKKKSKNKKTTYVAIVLDRSGSMEATKESTIMGYNEQVEEIQGMAKDADQDVKVCLVTFNHNVTEHLWLQDASQLKKAAWSTYDCDGMTALYDGVGYTVQKLVETTEPKEDDAYLVIVISDGRNNRSQHVSPSELTSQITDLDNSRRWTFTFNGCSKNDVATFVRDSGFKVENCAVWDNRTHSATAKGMTENTDKLKKYFRARASGATRSESYHSEVAGACADYTDGTPADTPQVRRAYGDNKRRGGARLRKSVASTPRSFAATAASADFLGEPKVDVSSAVEATPVFDESGLDKDVFGKGNAADWSNYSKKA